MNLEEAKERLSYSYGWGKDDFEDIASLSMEKRAQLVDHMDAYDSCTLNPKQLTSDELDHEAIRVLLRSFPLS